VNIPIYKAYEVKEANPLSPQRKPITKVIGFLCVYLPWVQSNEYRIHPSNHPVCPLKIKRSIQLLSSWRRKEKGRKLRSRQAVEWLVSATNVK